MGSRWLDIGQVFDCVFIDLYLVSANKNAKKERGQYPAILTEQAWSIQYLLYGLKENYFLRDPRGKSRTGKMGHLAARVANQNAGFALSCSVADSAI